MDPGDDWSLVLFVRQIANMKVPIIINMIVGPLLKIPSLTVTDLHKVRWTTADSGTKPNIGTDVSICRRLLHHLVMFRFDAE